MQRSDPVLGAQLAVSCRFAPPHRARLAAGYPGCEVHGGAAVQQERGYVHVAVVSSDVQRGESALEETDRAEGKRSDIKAVAWLWSS